MRRKFFLALVQLNSKVYSKSSIWKILESFPTKNYRYLNIRSGVQVSYFRQILSSLNSRSHFCPKDILIKSSKYFT